MITNYDVNDYFKAVEGVTLCGQGTSEVHDAGQMFNYLEFKDANGNIEKIEGKTLITNGMSMNFKNGAKGDFYFGFTNNGHWILLASDVGGERRTQTGFRISTLMGAAGAISAGFCLMFLPIALPLYIYLRTSRNKDAKDIINFLVKEKGFSYFS